MWLDSADRKYSPTLLHGATSADTKTMFIGVVAFSVGGVATVGFSAVAAAADTERAARCALAASLADEVVLDCC